MKPKYARLTILAGLVVCYCLGARAGRAGSPSRSSAGLPFLPGATLLLAAVLVPTAPVRKGAGKRDLAFANLGRRLGTVRTPKDAAQIIVDAADMLCGWDACVLDLCSPEGMGVMPVLCMDTINGRRTDISPGPDSARLSLFSRQVLKDGAQLVLRPDPPDFPPGMLPFGDKTHASASLMYVPVRKDSAVVGLLSVQSYTPNAYTRDDLWALQELAEICGGALERTRAEAAVNAELERRVRVRTAELEALNHELEAFAYSVSHDLRAPLRSICGFSEAIQDRCGDRLDALGQEHLRRICDSGRHMQHLIDDLLKLSRLGQSEMHRQRVNLSTLAESIVADLRKADPERVVEIVITPGLYAEADERLLRAALDNLLQNAWKFTSRNSHARIEFGFTMKPDFAFYVRDNGVGFDPAYADKLFGVFQRLHSANEFPGTGVGLATVRRIISRHRGRTWATSALNEGATFYFTLPANGGGQS
jgi:signal transduction histidine kinase